MKASDIPNECIGDPRFVKVLAASLCSEIAESKIILTEINTEIEGFKEIVSKGWKRRKILKQSIHELSKKKHILTGALESLARDEKHRSIEIETAKNRLDDGTLRAIQERAEFETILENYHDTWQKYKVEYEKRPSAIERHQCWINLKQLGVQYMIAEYKKEEIIKMIRQRWVINAKRIKHSLVDISEMVLNHWKDEKYLENLKRTTKKMEDELTTYTRQLSEMQQQEMERKRLAESDDTAKMPPPRLDFTFMRSINYVGEQRIQQPRRQPRSMNDGEHRNKPPEHWRATRNESDTSSINTLMLEEIFNEEANNVLPRPKNRSEKCNEARNANEIIQDESHDIVIPSSTLVFQQSTDFACPMKKRMSKSTAVPSTSMIINESKIRHKLQELDIERKNNSIAQYHHQEEQRSTTNDELNKTRNTNNNNCHYDHNEHEDRTKEYENDDNNVEGSRHQRTRRWCEELSYENLPPVYMMPNYKDSTSPDRENPSMKTECHLIIDENAKRQQKNLSRESDEKKKSKMDGNKGNTHVLGACHDQRDSIMESQLMDCIHDATIQRSKSRNNYSKTHLLYNDESSKPKMRKIVTNEDPEFIMEMEQPQQLQQKQRAEREITIEPNQSGNLSSPSLRYVSSCSNSDNLSHIGKATSWHETPQGTVAAELNTNVDFPSLSTWQNWSPPQLNSEISFTSSSIMDHQDNKKSDTQIHKEKINQNNSFLDFGGFMKKTNQKQRKMF